MKLTVATCQFPTSSDIQGNLAHVLWNTTYLARAVAYVRGQGVALTDEELSHVAPVRWDHIALTGDYLWSDMQTPRDRFRPLRISRFRPEAFRASLAA